MMANVRNDERLPAEMQHEGIDVVLTFSMANVFYLTGALFSLQDNIRERLAVGGFAGGGEDFLLCASNEVSAVSGVWHTVRLETYTEFAQAPIAALARLLAAMRPGMTERALPSAIVQSMYDAGAEVVRHVVVTVGNNARHAHPFPSSTKLLDPGDVFRIDVGGLFAGYGSDVARMAVVGAPSAEQRALYETARACVHTIGPALRPGMRACDAYEAAVAFYAAAGISGYRRDHIGHSLSILGGHDNPKLHAGNSQLLKRAW